MFYINGSLESRTRLKVIQTTVQPVEGWYEVEHVPEYPSPNVGVSAVMYFNPQSGEFWFEEVERELTTEELINTKISELEKENKQLKQLVADLTELLIESEVI